jgi:hypothetical protein
MRFACTLVLCLLPAQGAAPTALDWSLVPVRGDKDYHERMKRLRQEYHGKEVVVEGVARAVVSTTSRSVMIQIGQLARRGELIVWKTVNIRFEDVRQDRIRALADKGVRVRVAGTAAVVNEFGVGNARLVTGRPELRKKP